MLTLRRLSLLLFAATLTSLGCHAQLPAKAVPGKPLSPELARRVEVLVRQKAQLPPGSTVTVGPAQPSEFTGYNLVEVSITNEGKTSRPIQFLVSSDGKQAAQISKFDISQDPRGVVSPAGRPARGGPPTAPVLIVGFDDLECPYCARLHSAIFPAITERYGDKVEIVYKDFPLPADMHPWAMRAAVDVNCLAAESPVGYWHLVDTIHAHSNEIGSNIVPTPGPLADAPKEEKTLDRANTQLDKLTLEEGKNQKIDIVKLNACVQKQDTTEIEASQKVGTALGVDSTPSMFINGAKIDGAVPIDFVFGIIDDALRAQGITPPAPYISPAIPAAAIKPGR